MMGIKTGGLVAALLLVLVSVATAVSIPGGAAEDVAGSTGSVGGGRTARVGANIGYVSADLTDGTNPRCHTYHFALFGNYVTNTPFDVRVHYKTVTSTANVNFKLEARCVSSGESWYNALESNPTGSASPLAGSLRAYAGTVTPQAAGAASDYTFSNLTPTGKCCTGDDVGKACTIAGDCANGGSCNTDATCACDPFDLVVLRLCRITTDANTDPIEVISVDIMGAGL